MSTGRPLLRGLALALGLTACTPTPMQLSAAVANDAKAKAERAEFVEGQICVATYQAIRRLPVERRGAEDARVDPYCDRLHAALVDYETAWKALLAAELAAELGADNADALLADRRATLTLARLHLARATAGSP